jgi:hypothetical protein
MVVIECDQRKSKGEGVAVFAGGRWKYLAGRRRSSQVAVFLAPSLNFAGVAVFRADQPCAKQF